MNDFETLKEQIFAMMNYLGEPRASIGKGLFGSQYLDAESGKIKGDDKGLVTKWDLEPIHRRLVGECQFKALKKWADIELANNNLFWCCHE